MSHDLQQLRDAFVAGGSVDGGSVDGAAADEPVSAEELWSLAEGSMPSDEAAVLVDRLARSPELAEDYRLTREMVAAQAGEGRSAEEEPAAEIVSFPAPHAAREKRLPRTQRSSPPWRTALAVAAVLALAVGVWLQLPRGPEAPASYRQGPGTEAAIETPIANGTVMERSAVELRWTPFDGARYELLVTTRELDVVVEERFLESASFRVEEDLLRELPDGAMLIWQVEAVLPGGERLSSPAFEIVLSGSRGEQGTFARRSIA